MKFFTLLLFVGCAFGDSAWDELIDQAIDAAREEIIEKKLDIIHIPDLEDEFKEDIFGIPFSAKVKIGGAQFWNVSTLRRRGPVTVLQDDTTGNVTIATALGIDDFFVSCSNLFVQVFGLTVSGSVSTQCQSNVLEFSLSLITDKDDKCTAELNWARVTAFNEFTVKIQPAGIVNWLAEHVVSFVLNEFSSRVIYFINMSLEPAVNAALSKIDVCEIVPI